MGTGSPEKLLSKMSVSHADLNNFFRKCADPEKVRKKNVQKAKVADLKSWAASYILDVRAQLASYGLCCGS